MKRIIAVLSVALFILGCEKPKTEDGNAQPTFSLDKRELTIARGTSESFTITGDEGYYCADEGDDFVAYASSNGKSIEVEGLHVGETSITVSRDGTNFKDSCIVKVIPTNDCVGEVIPLWGSSESEVHELINKDYVRHYYNEQRKCQSYSYYIGDYFVVNMYYFSDGRLIGIHKTVDPQSETETEAYISISSSLNEYAEFISGSSLSCRIYNRPSSYFAAMYTPSLNDTFDIYYAPTIDDAKNHTFR